MAMTDDQRREAAEALFTAERTREYIEPISSAYPGADVADAYAIGQYVTDAKVAAGRQIKGHKVGLTAKVMREQFNATEPDYGTLFDDWFVDEGSTVSMATLNRPLAEIELLFVLGAPLGGSDVNAIDVINATDYVVPAIEVVDGRYNGRGANALVDSIADAASCGFVIVGSNPVSLSELDVRYAGGLLYKNGEVEESGMAGAVMGSPINSVAWLARKLHEFGVTMEPGHAVLSGSFTRAHPVAAGDSFVADFGPLGQISFGVSA
ncbi:MAG: 2-oxo-hepta-3-ene-1,7-dioate hydratase [Actinomycetota bacterium]